MKSWNVNRDLILLDSPNGETTRSASVVSEILKAGGVALAREMAESSYPPRGPVSPLAD